jgi:hypothetical protein
VTPEERDRMNQLCILIQSEKDHARLSDLVKELNELFEHKMRRLTERDARDPVP